MEIERNWDDELVIAFFAGFGEDAKTLLTTEMREEAWDLLGRPENYKTDRDTDLVDAWIVGACYIGSYPLKQNIEQDSPINTPEGRAEILGWVKDRIQNIA